MRAPRKPRKQKEPDRVDGARWIALTRGNFCLVDDVDYESMSLFNWYSDRNGYACRSDKNKKTVFMHREISGSPPGMDTDHRNGETWDNRRGNLRVATRQENLRNRRLFKNSKSGLRGVIRDGIKWRAHIVVDSKYLIIGRFDTAEEASVAYLSVAKEIHGEFFNQQNG